VGRDPDEEERQDSGGAHQDADGSRHLPEPKPSLHENPGSPRKGAEIDVLDVRVVVEDFVGEDGGELDGEDDRVPEPEGRRVKRARFPVGRG
jgi:hypothetical protein